jgi:putative tryptophan/tyrosine transport system substrate-binding protein
VIGRRDFITLLGGGATAWPLVARAQQAAMPVIGFLNSQSPGPFSHMVAAFLRGMNEAGIVVERDVVVEYRWAEGRYDLLPALARELVSRRVAVLAATGGEPVAFAAKEATSTIPIVFSIGSDAARLGLVQRINRPGGNITGVTLLTYEIDSKRLGLLLQMAPSIRLLGALINPDFPTAERQRQEILDAASRSGLDTRFAFARAEGEFEQAFETLMQQKVDALMVCADPLFNSRRARLIALAARSRLPAMYEFREFPLDGGLMSYGVDIVDIYRQVGRYTAAILKGASPAELPVLQPTKFALTVNLATARTLGLNVPPMLLALADEVIE